PPGLGIDNAGLISGAIGSRAAGTSPYTVTVSGSDGGVPGNTVTFTWAVADTTPPALTSPGSQASNEGAAVSLAVQAADADPGTLRASGLPPGLTIDPMTGLISGAIGSRAAGTYAVTVSASDGGVTGSAG